MTVSEWTAVLAVFFTFVTLCAAMLRFYVKAILREFSPNGGNTLRDRINRIEERQIHIFELLASKDNS